MSLIFFSIIALLTLILVSWVISRILIDGKWEYSIYFLLLFLPFYITILSVTYQGTGSTFAVGIFQYLKEIVVISAVLSFVLYQKNLIDYPFRLHRVDLIFLAFLALAFVFLILPIGEASLLNKTLYFKNMLIPAFVYFLGRNTRFEDKEVGNVFRIIFVIAIAAFGFNLLEGVLGTHLQSFTGYAQFNQSINNVEPSGNFGLSWTFETQAITKRFASFFSDPLELASSILMGFAAGLIWFLSSKREDSFLYLVVMVCSMGSLFFSASRAAFAAFFVMIFFIAIIFRLHKLILFGVSLAMIFVLYVIFFASEDFYFFVIDTLTFQNESSIGHVLEWLLALESMIESPLGIGLAMSGGLGSVDEEVRVGGENQFLIYGVQMGFVGMILYILLLAYSITYSIKVFRSTGNVMTARVAFTGAAVKTGMLLPLFTANAEMYAYVSWISWWMIGYAMNHYSKIGLPDEKA